MGDHVVRVDGMLMSTLRDAGGDARHLEELGYDGVLTAETQHDPFLPLLMAAEHTHRLELATSICVAFGRTPMPVAVTAHDLHEASHGRFVLGLGSQIRPHIERRYSMPWSHPALRMREFILAVRAIWRAFDEGERLDFRGDFYQHTLMTPFFNPGPSGHPAPKVRLAAVGEHMAEVAGEVADGIVLHAFTTERYLREVTLPAVERGLARGGRSRDAFEVCLPGFIISGDEAEVGRSREMVRQQLAFYGSTPAYRGVLEVHGWGELQGELNRLSKQGAWSQMGALISDEMLDTFAVAGPPEVIADRVLARFGGVVDRVSLQAPGGGDAGAWSSIVERLHEAGRVTSA